MTDSWLEELDLGPASPWLTMGTRALGQRPWLVIDEHAAVELAERAQLLSERRDEVFVTQESAGVASEEVLALVRAELAMLGRPIPTDPATDPLERAGRLVQEDLVLMHWRDEAWRLDAACVCFASRWRLADKFQRPMLGIHRPVDGYADGLADKVNTMMSRLGHRPVWRRNWFVHPDPSLFQPDRGDDPLIPTDRCRNELFVRSERQTLRRLATDGWVLFTIRIQHCGLGELIDARGEEFATFISEARPSSISHHGISPAQARQLAQLV